MKYRIFSSALALAFAMTLYPVTSEAGGGRNGGGGGWIANGSALSGVEASGSSALTLRGLQLPSIR